MLPKDLFCSQNFIKKNLASKEKWNFDIYDDFNYEDIDELLTDIKLKKIKNTKTILLTSLQSEYERLSNFYKSNINIGQSTPSQKMQGGINKKEIEDQISLMDKKYDFKVKSVFTDCVEIN